MSDSENTFDDESCKRISDTVQWKERSGTDLTTQNSVHRGGLIASSMPCRIVAPYNDEKQLYPAKFVKRKGITDKAYPTTSTTTTTTTLPPGTTTTTTTLAPCLWEYVDPNTDQDCWLALIPTVDVKIGDIHDARFVGIHPKEDPDDDEEIELGIYLTSSDCSGIPPVTTTTTTNAPCTGTAQWTFNTSSKQWELTSNTCSGGCNPEPPQFCPEAEAECSEIETLCTSLVVVGVNCNPCAVTSTTTSTTSTVNPSCTNCCSFRFVPGIGWIQIENNCIAPCICNVVLPTDGTPCQVISGGGLGVDPPPIQPGCSGNCTWVDGGEGIGWVLSNTTCIGIGCTCQQPSIVGVCGQVSHTECGVIASGSTTTTTTLAPGSTTTSTCSPTTTTTLPPGTCTGSCVWKRNEDNDGWDLVSAVNCVGCSCLEPEEPIVEEVGPGTTTTTTTTHNPCKYVTTPCGTFTTTTTSTTTTTTTTINPGCGTCTGIMATDSFLDPVQHIPCFQSLVLDCEGDDCTCTLSYNYPPCGAGVTSGEHLESGTCVNDTNTTTTTSTTTTTTTTCGPTCTASYGTDSIITDIADCYGCVCCYHSVFLGVGGLAFGPGVIAGVAGSVEGSCKKPSDFALCFIVTTTTTTTPNPLCVQCFVTVTSGLVTDIDNSECDSGVCTCYLDDVIAFIGQSYGFDGEIPGECRTNV